MTNEVLKEHFIKQKRVAYNGRQYNGVNAIIYRHDGKGNLIVSAELLDACKNSVIIAKAKDIEGVV